jgi:hypothetical protein
LASISIFIDADSLLGRLPSEPSATLDGPTRYWPGRAEVNAAGERPFASPDARRAIGLGGLPARRQK